MQVYKFGGASIRDAKRIKEIPAILRHHRVDQLLIVVSALGKTTNSLERVLDHYMASRVDAMKKELASLRKNHYYIMDDLFQTNHAVYDDINDTFEELNWILEEEPVGKTR